MVLQRCREPEETKEGEAEADDFGGDASYLPAPVGAADNWGEPAAEAAPVAYGAGGFEAAGERFFDVAVHHA